VGRNRKGVELVRIGELPQEHDSETPGTVVINPLPCTAQDYWDKIRGFVSSHPGTRFLIVATHSTQKLYVELEIGERENVEYLTFTGDGTKSIMDLLEE